MIVVWVFLIAIEASIRCSQQKTVAINKAVRKDNVRATESFQALKRDGE